MKVKFYMMLFIALLSCISFNTYAEDYKWIWYNGVDTFDSPDALCAESGGYPSYPLNWGGAGPYGCWGVCYNSYRGPCFIRVGDQCPTGTQMNETTGACEKTDPPPTDPGIKFTPNGDCKSGVWNTQTKSCEPINTGCPDGQVKNSQGKCVPEPECPEGQSKNDKGQCVCPEGEAKGIDGICKPECPTGNSRNAITGQCEPDCKTQLDTTGQCNAEAGAPPEGVDPNPNNNCGSSAMNPILIATGQKVERATDIVIDNSAITFKRNYWSSRVEISNVGLGWQHNWRMHILPLSERNKVKLYRNDGSGITFTPLENGQWLAPAGSNIALLSLAEGGWKVIENGNIERYNAKGQLIHYNQQDFSPITFVYNSIGQLTSVSDTAKNSLTLTYNDKGLLTQVTSSQGLSVSYSYDAKYRLISVTKNNKTIKYHYENSIYPNALTGITDERGVRYVTWIYNDQGLAISGENAGGANKYQLEFLSNDRTRVINPLGGSTVYHFKNYLLKREIVKVEGEAIGSCIASQATYNRNYQGLITNQEDKNGGITTYDYNDRGLETKRIFYIKSPSYIYSTTTTTWHDLFPLPLEINKDGWRTTFKYDDNGRLINKTTYSQ